jgi:TPP-dependent indolepyruvate ferredoxin oxidoreductase alpha subunit
MQGGHLSFARHAFAAQTPCCSETAGGFASRAADLDALLRVRRAAVCHACMHSHVLTLLKDSLLLCLREG